MADMDWSEMEGLFCLQAPPSPKLGVREPASNNADPVERRLRKDNAEVSPPTNNVGQKFKSTASFSDHFAGW